MTTEKPYRFTASSTYAGKLVQDVQLTITRDADEDYRGTHGLMHRPWTLSWFDKDWNRYHVFVSRDDRNRLGINAGEGEWIYKNPPLGTPMHLETVTAAGRRLAYSRNPAWFETRRLDGSTAASKARLAEALTVVDNWNLVGEALCKRAATLAEEETVARARWHKAALTQRKIDAADRMVELLKAASAVLESLEAEDVIGSLSTTEEIRHLLRQLDEPTGFEPEAPPPVKPEIDNTVPF
jgi:hypothetical protein